jgi:glutathione S-transferase
MGDLVLTTYDWVPPPPRGFVRDIRVRWALEEAKLPYRVESVSFKERGPEHLAHQPFGQVPWLTDGDISIFESGAILLHLGERSDALMPADPRGRSETLEWLFAALNSVEMASLPWSILQFSSENGDTPARKLLDGFLKARLQHLEPVLADANGWPGPSPSSTYSWRMCFALSIGSTAWQDIPSVVLCRPRHGPPVLRKGTRRPDGAFCCGRLSNTGAKS